MDNKQLERDFPISRYLTAKANKLGLPLHGTFELTSRCNFNCRMCYVHDTTRSCELKEKELSAGQWLEIAEDAKKCGTLFLLLTGGEAMLREDFVEIYSKLSTMGFRIVVNTNGSLINDEIVDCFRKYPPGRVNVSLYGASEKTYEKLCGAAANGRVVENIRKMKRSGISLRLLMTATPYNYQDMEMINNFAREEDLLLEVGTYMFPPIRLDESSRGENAGRLSAEDAGKALIRWERLRYTAEKFHQRACRKIHECEQIQEQTTGAVELGEKSWCQAGKSAYWITWEGKMRPCGLMICPEADVLQNGFAAAWQKIHTEADKIRLPKECAACDKKNICRACAAMSLSETGSFDKRPEYACRMAEQIKQEYYQEVHGKRGIL